MNWREALQKAVDKMRYESGVVNPEFIFIDEVRFAKNEWTALRESRYLMEHFDLVMEFKKTGIFVAEDLLPKSINGYNISYTFEVTPPEYVYEGCIVVRYGVRLLAPGKATAFGETEVFDLNGRANDEFFKNYIGSRIREEFEKLLHCICRAANEKRREEESHNFQLL